MHPSELIIELNKMVSNLWKLRNRIHLWICGSIICVALFILTYKRLAASPETKEPPCPREIIHQPKPNPCDFATYVFGKHVDQEDPCLIETFRKKMLIPPPPSPPLYTDTEIRNHPDIQDIDKPANVEKFQWAKKLVGTKGFFVDLGANNGIRISSTLRLERDLNWTGLLIEPLPSDFQKLVHLKRNAWLVNAAACDNPYPEEKTLYYKPNDTPVSGFKPFGHRLSRELGLTEGEKVTVQCIPLYTMLKAVQKTEVDYLSLDVEGYELLVLKTLPWDKVSFKIMAIEYEHVEGGSEALTAYLFGKGYKLMKFLNDGVTNDNLFVHESIYEKALAMENTILD